METVSIFNNFGPIGNVLVMIGGFAFVITFVIVHFINVNKLQKSIDEIKVTLGKILVDNEKKVSYEWLEKELIKYLPKDVADERANTIRESIKHMGERLGELEKKCQ